MTTLRALVAFFWMFSLLAAAPLPAEEPASAPEKPQPGQEESEPAAPPEVQLPGLTVTPYSGGYFSVGGRFGNSQDALERVAEYEAFRQGTWPTTRLGLWGFTAGLAYELEGERGVDPTDQQYRIDADWRRYWRSELFVSKLPHRLINDPLTNLDTGKGPVIVRHDSLDEGIDYCPYYRELSWRNSFRFPFQPLLELRFDYRNQGREGSFQARTMSKCANCHVSSSVRSMNRETEEFVLGMALEGRSARVEYDFTSRGFREGASAPLNLFDEVQHPASQLRVFTNRMQFEASDGPLPFAALPRLERNQHRLRAWLELPRDFGTVSTTLLDARSQNSSIGYGVDSRLISGRYSVRLGERLGLSVQGRNLDVSGDTLFVDVIERPADGGPQAGLTFPEAYPDYGEPDYFTRSSLEREQFDFRLDGRLRLPARNLLRFGYDFQELERPLRELARTQTHNLRVGISSLGSRRLKARARYVFTKFRNPFAHLHAALPPALQPFPSPGSPPSPFGGTQYFEVYGARVADLSNFPHQTHQFTGSATWSPTDRLALSGHFRLRDSVNDELNDFGDWQDTEISPSFDLWFAPLEKLGLAASYSYHRRRSETLFGIAVYDG